MLALHFEEPIKENAKLGKIWEHQHKLCVSTGQIGSWN